MGKDSFGVSIKTVYEDRDFVILNKPAGVLVHEARAGKNKPLEEPTIVSWLIAKYPEIAGVGDNSKERPGIVHRLDRETSGVMVAARNQAAFLYLKKLFQESRVKKAYIALVLGRVSDSSGVIDKPIGLKPGTTKRTIRVDNAKMVKPAKTNYRVLKELCLGNQDFSLIEARPETGRTHQIRVHFLSIGHPVVGDKLYGGKAPIESARALGLDRQALHAESIEFTSRDGNRIRASADLPPDLERALALLSPAPGDHQRHN